MKYVLVTGANGGMGAETVKLLSSSGFTVFALDINPPKEQDGVIPIACDITSIESVEQAFEIVSKKTDNLYAVVHLAGIYVLDSLVEISEEKIQKIFDVNFLGAYRINKIFLPMLKKGSRIVVTTSELAPLSPLPFTGVYAITKSALDNYAYSLRMELQLKDIFVSVLRPGAVDTKMIDKSTSDLDQFVSRTRNYSYNAVRFKSIVDSVESKKIPPIKIAERCRKILLSKKPKFVYKTNRNKLLLLLNALPKRLQTYIIKKILKEKRK